MRARPLVIFSVAAALLLSGCAASPAPTRTEPTGPAVAPVDLCALAVPSGPISDGVAVEGTVGSPPVVSLTAPLTVTSPERTVAVEGDGDPIDAGTLVDYAMTVFDAATGDKLQVQGYDGVATLPVPAVNMGEFFGCVPVGSRIVMAVPERGGEPASVWVVDVLGTLPARATGAAQAAVAGMPTVQITESGAPAVTVPGGEPPAETEIAVLKKGDGEVVGAGELVMIQYSVVRWSDGSLYDSTWSSGAPTALSTNEVIPGYREALEGQTVGSQVLAVIPPAAAYGEGEINEDDLTGETLVVVIDILDTLGTN